MFPETFRGISIYPNITAVSKIQGVQKDIHTHTHTHTHTLTLTLATSTTKRLLPKRRLRKRL